MKLFHSDAIIGHVCKNFYSLQTSHFYRSELIHTWTTLPSFGGSFLHHFTENGNLLIPVFSNQKLNNYLKELGGVVKISKRLTTHVGRRTAATFFLNAGVPLSTVSTILGHTNPIITKARYAKLNPDTAINEVNKAMKKRRKKKDNDDKNDLQVAV